jgi:hypothetical protein
MSRAVSLTIARTFASIRLAPTGQRAGLRNGTIWVTTVYRTAFRASPIQRLRCLRNVARTLTDFLAVREAGSGPHLRCRPAVGRAAYWGIAAVTRGR